MASGSPDSTPDFTTLYGTHNLTPTMAAKLWTVAVSVGDAFAEGMGDLWLDDLPTVAKQFADDAFVAAFASRVESRYSSPSNARWRGAMQAPSVSVAVGAG